MKNTELERRKQAAMPRGMPNLLPVYVSHAENAEIWDVEGNRYIDFGTGIAVLNAGHLHPRIKAAVQAQLDQFSHTCLMITPYESAVALAEALNAAVPGAAPRKTLFVTTGAEAVENAIKLARAHTRRPGVIAFGGGFHGRTLLSLALTGKTAPYKVGFGPFPSGIYHAPFPINYHGISSADALAGLQRIFREDIEPDQIAAMIIEPVQGEGGFYPAPPEFLRALRTICDDHGIVLIADEIQSGFARTGKMFAIEHAGVEPDLVTMAKGLAGGLPLAAVTGRAEIMDGPAPGGLGGTYAGSPLGCVAALAMLEVIKSEQLCRRATVIGERLRQRLQALAKLHPAIGEVRNLGAMVAMELVRDGDPNQPAQELTKTLVQTAAKRGLLLLSCGYRGNVVRFLPALTASDAILDEGLDILADCLAELNQP